MKLGRVVAYARRNHLALLALFIALGGTSYAAVKLPANSVGSRQLQAGAVTGAKLKADAVTGAKIADNTVTETEVADGAITSNEVRDGTVTLRDLAFESFRGERGFQGPEGPQGATGPRGATGPQGPAGPVGNMDSSYAYGLTQPQVGLGDRTVVVGLNPLTSPSETGGPLSVPFDARVLAVGTVELENEGDTAMRADCRSVITNSNGQHASGTASVTLEPGAVEQLTLLGTDDSRFQFSVDIKIDCAAEQNDAIRVLRAQLLAWALAR